MPEWISPNQAHSIDGDLASLNEAEARQQPLVQPKENRGQYDDCKLLLDFHSSCLCVAENVSSLASAQTIAGTCISLPSDVCNLVGIRTPGHVPPRTLVLQRPAVVTRFTGLIRRPNAPYVLRGVLSDVCNPRAFQAPDASPSRDSGSKGGLYHSSLSCVAENVSSLASAWQIAGGPPFVACATLLAFQAYDVILLTALTDQVSQSQKPARSQQPRPHLQDARDDDHTQDEREDNRALDLLKRDPIIDLTNSTRYRWTCRGRTKMIQEHREQNKAKDEMHTPFWDRKIQREFEATNPGPPKRKSGTKKVAINISDDEPDEKLGRVGDDWTVAIWDELVKDRPEHWDMHDALRLGKQQDEDPSSLKRERPRGTSPTGGDERLLTDTSKQKTQPIIFMDARDWEGKDLDRAVDEGHLTFEQASSIMRIRNAVAKPQPYGVDVQQRLHSLDGDAPREEAATPGTGCCKENHSSICGSKDLMMSRSSPRKRATVKNSSWRLAMLPL